MDMMTKKEIAEMFGMSPRTVQSKVNRIEQLKDRYSKYAVVRSGNKLYINVVAFFDYLAHESELSSKWLAKYAEPFDYNDALMHLKGGGYEFDRNNRSKTGG